MKKNVRYMMVVFMAVVMLCGLNGCSSINDNADTEQFVEQDTSGRMGETETILNEEHNDTEKETSGETLDVVVPNPADDDWYMKGSIYTDDKGNQLEVFFNDHGTLEFAVNGISMYFTQVDNFEQENNWKIYTCDDGTMIAYYPGEPAHLEISDGDYAGLYAE